MAQPTLLSYARDIQGIPADSPAFPITIWTATLTTGAATNITIPGNKGLNNYVMYVRVQPTGWVWVSRTGTASVPAGNTLASASSELICGTIEYRRQVLSGDIVSFITPNTSCDIEVAIYSHGYSANTY